MEIPSSEENKPLAFLRNNNEELFKEKIKPTECYTEASNGIPQKDLTLVTAPALKWRKSVHADYVHKLPYFIFLVSVIQITVYSVADKRLKRILMYDVDNMKQMWRFVTYMFLHTDLIHLASNVVIQGFLGSPLEFEQGHFRCAAIYFGGGLAGSLGASVFTAHPLMAGASGGIYALLMSQIPHVLLNYKVIKYKEYRMVVVAVLTAFDVVYIFCHMYFYNNESPRICWVAHVSGAVSGFLLGFLIFEGNSKWRKKFQMTSFCLLLITFVTALGYNFLSSTPTCSDSPS